MAGPTFSNATRTAFTFGGLYGGTVRDLKPGDKVAVWLTTAQVGQAQVYPDLISVGRLIGRN